MKVKLTETQLEQLKQFIETCTDAEMLSAREAVVDLYDNETPVSLDFVYVKGGIGVDGAAKLLYSEEDKGYYMGERIEDPAAVRAALIEAGAITGE